MASTKIEWTEASWNPVTGCTKISSGCRHCYAERMSRRLQARGQENYRNGFKVTCHEKSLEIPFKWRKPRMIFVNSMSDLFHKKVPVAFVDKVFQVISSEKRHCFQVLTKRSGRLSQVSGRFNWTTNIWMGVSVESNDYLQRIDDLRKVPASVRFISLEPLLGALPDLDLTGIDWVIAGGESGPGTRPMRKEWVVDIRNRCQEANVPFFFKQWGGVNKKKAGRRLDNHTWDQMPSSGSHIGIQSIPT